MDPLTHKSSNSPVQKYLVTLSIVLGTAEILNPYPRNPEEYNGEFIDVVIGMTNEGDSLVLK